MRYSYRYTYQRNEYKKELTVPSNDPQIQKIARLAAQSLRSTFINMELEIPLMVYTEKFFLSVDYSLGCTNYYMDYFKFEKKIA